jgi:carboxyl-terminal processing protease
MYTSTVDWDLLQKQIHQHVENAKTIVDLQPAFETLLNALRDHHGKILNATNYVPIAYFTDSKNHRHPETRTKELEVWKIVNDTSLHFAYKLLDGHIGYLKIVGIGPNADIEAESKKIRAAVIELHEKKAERWIVDLRYNGGGNIHPMIEGIATLIGDGKVGSITNLNNEKLFDWEIKNGNFIYHGFQAVDLINQPTFSVLPRIAVLTSRWTVSSGELTAVALKGRPNTKFFGESTGGFTTNTNWEIINNQVIVCISSGIYADRNGVIYEHNIPVDIEIPFEVETNPEKDKCVLTAKKWLEEH